MGKHIQHDPQSPKKFLTLLRGGSQTPAWVIGVAVAVLLLAVGGTAVGLLASQGSGAASVVAADPVGSGHPSTPAAPPKTPIYMTSVTPTNNATGVGGGAPITINFSTAVAPSTPMPTLSPSVPGTWHVGADTITFTPSGGYIPSSTETLTIPGGPVGILAVGGNTLSTSVVDHFSVIQGSTLRLQQLMSILDYSPLTWTPSGAPISATDTSAQTAAAFAPPAGTFTWTSTGWPTNLTALWQPGSYNTMTKGLVMAFEADHGLTVDGIAGPQVWTALLNAVATNQLNTGGYNFVLVSEASPETLTIWHNGQQVLQSPANTGVPGALTATGTFNVYERLLNQVMVGTDVNGYVYHAPVKYVAYFNGGDAVHYYYRSSYGFPQSNGCVELPLQAAAQAYPYTSYGTMVQVVG